MAKPLPDLTACLYFPLGLTGILFPESSDAAFSALRIWLAIGFTAGFAIANFLSVRACVWFTLAAALVALASDLAIEIKTQPNLLRPMCCRRQSKPESSGVAGSGAGGQGDGLERYSKSAEMEEGPSVDDKVETLC